MYLAERQAREGVPLPESARCAQGVGEDSEGFLEAVILSRVLEGRFIYLLNEYSRLLCASRPNAADLCQNC